MGLYDGKTVLPAAVQRAWDLGDDRTLIAALGELPLPLFHSAARELTWLVSGPPVARRSTSFWERLRALLSGRKVLHRSPYPGLFHRSGYVREAALKALKGPVPNAFFIVALAYRLNDWVPDVRATATEALRRTSRYTDPAILAQALLFLFLRSRDWSRWGDEKTPLDALLDLPDVAAIVATSMGASLVGPHAKILRQALRQPAMDVHLPELLRCARQPAVRALALRVLAEGGVEWEAGPPVVRQWIDKSLGRFRFVRRTEGRPVVSPFTLPELIEIGAADKSAAVRLAAATALSLNFAKIPAGRAFAERLATDKSRAVRERAAFLLR